MNITIPDEILTSAHVSEDELRLELALVLYTGQRVTLGQAARVAGISQAALLREMGRRRIAVNYGTDDLAADIEAVGRREGP